MKTKWRNYIQYITIFSYSRRIPLSDRPEKKIIPGGWKYEWALGEYTWPVRVGMNTAGRQTSEKSIIWHKEMVKFIFKKTTN